MNRISFTKMKGFALMLFMSLMAVQPSYAHMESKTVVKDRIRGLDLAVEVKFDQDVMKRLDQYLVSQRKSSEVLLGLGNLYFPTFERILQEEGVPQELKYLAAVESGLRPYVTSKSGAAGLWQFMRPTGRMMGLKITRTIDERRDIEKSTRAAAQYLKSLYEQFDDWTLALAAYNCGPGNLRKAIRRSGGKKSFWEIKKFLPRETREYVPKFIAMTYMMSHYYDHDLVPEMPDEDLVNTTTATVFETIKLRDLSRTLDIDFKIIKMLNPIFVRNYIPKSSNGEYILKLPTQKMSLVVDKYHIEPHFAVEETVEEEVEPQNRYLIHISAIPNVYSSNTGAAQLRSITASNWVHLHSGRADAAYRNRFGYKMIVRDNSLVSSSLAPSCHIEH